jgi:hypothetical protein
LVADLEDEFGKSNVFRDIDSIQPAEQWRLPLEAAVQKADVVLVVIGPKWVNAAKANGVRRLANPHDTVRREVATALQYGKHVLPVLVGGATKRNTAPLRKVSDPVRDWSVSRVRLWRSDSSTGPGSAKD